MYPWSRLLQIRKKENNVYEIGILENIGKQMLWEQNKTRLVSYIMVWIVDNLTFAVFILGCFSNHKVKQRYISKPYRFKVTTPKECQTKCQDREECHYFQLDYARDCYLKTASASNSKKSANEHYTFGPKYCEGRSNYISKM